MKIDLAGLPAQIGLMLARATHVDALEGEQNVAEADRHGEVIRHGEVTRGSLLAADILSKSAPTFFAAGDDFIVALSAAPARRSTAEKHHVVRPRRDQERVDQSQARRD